MKKGFGWFFIVCGVGSLIRGFAMFSMNEQLAAQGGRLITFAIGFIVLGIWMVSSSGKKPPKEDF